MSNVIKHSQTYPESPPPNVKCDDTQKDEKFTSK